MGDARRPSLPGAASSFAAGSPANSLRLSLIVLSTPGSRFTAEQASAALAALGVLPGGGELIVAPVGELGSHEADGALTFGDFKTLAPAASVGDALRAAGRLAGGELLAIGPADALELGRLPELLAQASQYDVVASTPAATAYSALQRVVVGTFELGLGALLRTSVRDASQALLLIPRRHWPQLEPTATSRFALTEIPLAARLAGLTVLDSAASTLATGSSPGPGTGSRTAREVGLAACEAARFAWKRWLFAGRSPIAAAMPSLGRLSLLVAIAAAMLLTGLNAPLTEPDEGRHAEIAREMWASGDWLAPQFLREPYLDKPPMLYWLCTLSYEVFGPQIWAARLVPASCAVLTVLLTYLLGRRLLGDDSAWLGGLVLTLSLGFVTCGRFLILESVLTLFVVAALLCGGTALAADRLRRGWWAASAVLCGLGVLTKGPIALVIVLPPLAVQGWLQHGACAGAWRRWAGYLGLVLALAAPWYIAVMIERPEFMRYFFWEHNLKRFLTGTNHPEPVWFYVPVLLLAMMPWTLGLVWVVRFLASGDPANRALRSPELGFLLLWGAWVLSFFSLAAGKLPYYILSSLPPLCLLIGDYLARVNPVWSRCEGLLVHQRLRHSLALLALVCLGIGPVIYGMGLISASAAGLLIGGWAMALGVILYGRHVWSLRTCWRVFCAVACCGVSTLTQLALPGWQLRYAVLTPAQIAEQRLRDDPAPLTYVGRSWGSIAFYTGRADLSKLDRLDTQSLLALVESDGVERLLLDRGVTPDDVRRVLPQGVNLRPLLNSRRATLVELTLAPAGASSRLADRGAREPLRR